MHGAIPSLRLPDDLVSVVKSGHPWIYRDHLPRHRLQGGELVRVESGSAAAYGLYDAQGAIALRLLSWEGVPDEAWWRDTIHQALAKRQTLLEAGHTAYRLLFGEGDGLPGLIADRYGRFAMIEPYAPSLEPYLPMVARTLRKAAGLKGVARRRDGELEVLAGDAPPPEETVIENGLRFIVNFQHGQKTGLFLDHREHRALIRDVSESRRVLNLFAYAGGFSVHALAGGASEVWSVDVARAALADAERNVRLNQLPSNRHRTFVEDVFELLPKLLDGNERFDLVIVDPPSLARRKSQRENAIRAYQKVNEGAAALVRPGGLLATASCTAQVSPRAFDQAVDKALTRVSGSWREVTKSGHALDHPLRPGFPEGRYLKFRLLERD